MTVGGEQVVTIGTLLGGRVRHDQFRDGHRTGIEPVFMAASIPARDGARVLEAGTGSGAALLCLAARVSGLNGVGVERDRAVADLARANLRANNHQTVDVQDIDIADFSAPDSFDHAMANPPWHRSASTPSPDDARDAAHRGEPPLLKMWTARMTAALRPRGTLTMIVAAAVVTECLGAFTDSGLGAVSIFPLWPRAGVAAKRVVLRAIKGARGPCRVLAGLTLHECGNGYTADANAVLIQGAPLIF